MASPHDLSEETPPTPAPREPDPFTSSSTVTAQRPRWDARQRLYLLALAGLVAPLILAGQMWASLARYPYDWDPGEGDNIFYASQIAHGESPYGDYQRYPMTGDCYTPLYHAAVAPLVRAVGREVNAGRAVSWLATLASAALVAALVRALAGPAALPAAALAGLAYLAGPICRLWGSLARIDALLTALGLATFFALATGRPTWTRAVVGALLGVAATYTKQYGVLFLGAGLLLMAVRDKRRAAVGTAVAGVVGFAVLAGLQRWSGGWFWKNTVTANATEYVWHNAIALNLQFLAMYAILLGLGVAGVVLLRGRPRLVLGVLLLAAAAPALLSGKAGAVLNYHLPLTAGLAVAAGCALARVPRERPGPYAFLPVLLAIQGVLWFSPTMARAPGSRERGLMSAAQAALAEVPGPALIERHMTLQARAGKEPVWEPCLLTYLYEAGRWDPAPVAADLEQGRFAMVLTSGTFFPAPLEGPLKSRYRKVARLMLPDWRGDGPYLLFVDPAVLAALPAPAEKAAQP